MPALKVSQFTTQATPLDADLLLLVDVAAGVTKKTTFANLKTTLFSGFGAGVSTFLATPTSANLAAAVTNETGSGALVFGTSPTLVTPNLGTPTTLVGTNITGTAAGLTAGNVTTNANLTGDVTSIGNATTLTSAISGARSWSGLQNFLNGITTPTIQTTTVNGNVIIGGDGGTGFTRITRGASTTAAVTFTKTGGIQFNDALLSSSSEWGIASDGIWKSRSSGGLAISSSSTTGSIDVQLSRNAAGIMEINNGNAGTFRDLIVRNLGVGVSPTVSVDILSGNNEIMKFLRSGQSTGWVIGQAGVGGALGFAAGDAFQYDNGGAKAWGIRTSGSGSANFVITSAGKLGINEAASSVFPVPAATIHAVSATGDLLRLERVTGAQANIWHSYITSSPVSGAGLNNGSLTIMAIGAVADFAVTTSGTTNKPDFVIKATTGNIGIGLNGNLVSPTASLHIRAGTTAASSAPLKFTSGSLMSSPEAGAVEFLTDAFYATITTGAARKTFAFLEGPTFSTSITGSYLTASQILITDGSKNIVSAAVATYPSLTELTYVKGVTSAIQTQIDGKQATLVSGTNIKTINGNTLLGSGDLVISGGSGATTALDNLASVAINAALVLGTSDAFALGSATKQWSDLFLAEGGVINFDNGDVTMTQVGNALTVAGGDFKVSAASVVLDNATYYKARDVGNTADLNMWRVNASDFMDFGTTIYRDDYAIYDDRKSWVNLRRVFTAAPTAGVRDRVIDVRVQTKQSGTVSNGRVGINSTIGDRSDVTNKTITGAADNGSGLIRITSTSHGYATSDKINIYGVGGTTEANGVWTITVITANTFDLQGSTFTNTYTSGGTATNRGLYYAVVGEVAPLLDRGGLTGTGQYGDDVACFVGYNAGSGKGTDAYYLGRNALISGSEWITGFTIDANCDYGIRLNGTFVNYGLDFYAGTYTGGAMRLKNNAAVFGRNFADGADVSLFQFNTSNVLQFNAASSFAGDVTFDTTTMFVDSVNNRVGIGTITPSYPLQVSAGTQTATSGTFRGISTSITLTPASASSATITGINTLATTSGSQDLSGISSGANISLTNTSTGTATDLRGVSLLFTNNAASGTVTTGYGALLYFQNINAGTIGTATGGLITFRNTSTGNVTTATATQSELQNTGGATITTGKGVYVPVTNSSGTITTLKGIDILFALAGGTVGTTYGIYIGDITSGTQTNQAWGIYQADTAARNFFGSWVEVPTLELGHASDTTLSRVSAGVIAVEGSTLAMISVAQTWTATQTFYKVNHYNNAIAAVANAATVPITYTLNTVTNSSAATLTITMTTTSAVDGQTVMVRILDFSAVAQTITWVNTENSTVSAPTTSNGSTTLFLTVGFIYNSATSKWRCIASA